ncbi:monocarboxylate transporter 12 [Bradysia coprophila]|uniref:monocarboxylate transporter 12 n=1 Tax=Bradysia coprophila TaxID=38358 RepID=UPI00187DDA28|nr:monocarboxylate transporter 12 [Bradysia coprophila]XP_037044266.1 monocarboxylate transporter 12 [Bradysia coprophila]XP_037044267.1 monocarboxylate transporter 12 [Bradysia coprophila]XP_037044268.1 monocarboxylate transporter 12 [Bradysia coprophila]
MSSSPSKSFAPPDGGWGWMVVFGVALTNIFNQSLISIFGLLFGEHLQSLGQTTVGAALVMNLNSVALNFSGLIIGPLLKRYSPRTVCAVGSLFTSSGLILSSFTTELWQVCITYGILVGIGLGLINPSTFIAVNSYFTSRRGQAIGLAMAGTGVGQMIMPHVVRALLDNYSFKGTILIMGGLALNGIVGASFFQPVNQHLRLEKDKSGEDKLLLKNVHSDGSQCSDDEDIVYTVKPTVIELIKPKTLAGRISDAMDLKLLKDLTFINISIGIALTYTATVNFSMIFPYFLQETAGLSNNDVALCMSVLAGTDLASRLTLPTLTDKFKISCRTLFLSGGFLLLIIRTILAETLHRTNLICMSALYGYFRAAIVVNQNLTISEYVAQERLAGALGLNMITKGIFVITIGQILGWIRDYYQSYPVCLYAQNVLAGIVIITWSTELMFKRYNTSLPIVTQRPVNI